MPSVLLPRTWHAPSPLFSPLTVPVTAMRVSPSLTPHYLPSSCLCLASLASSACLLPCRLLVPWTAVTVLSLLPSSPGLYLPSLTASRCDLIAGGAWMSSPAHEGGWVWLLFAVKVVIPFPRNRRSKAIVVLTPGQPEGQGLVSCEFGYTRITARGDVRCHVCSLLHRVNE
jgi:hypothetical protein